MISLIGFGGLCSSFVFSIIIVITYFFDKKYHFKKTFYYLIFLSLISIFISFFSLMYAYIISDFSNYNVFQNSHSSKPLLYKITGTWGNHEGSMLLWLTIMLIYNFIFSFNKTLESNVKKLTIFFKHYFLFVFVYLLFLHQILF